MDSVTEKTSSSVQGEQSAKKMKQARLPFKPLMPSPTVNAARKRKHSSSGSASPKSKEKQPKPSDSAEKAKPSEPSHDYEVSSSSEAENGNSKAKNKNNLLEAFVVREDEISSTIIDLTEDQEVDENKPAALKSPKKSPQKRLPESPSMNHVAKEKTEEHFARKLVFAEDKAKDEEQATSEDSKKETGDKSVVAEKGDSDDVMVVTDNESDSSDKDDSKDDKEEEMEEVSEEPSDQSANASVLETSVTDADLSVKEGNEKKTPLRGKRKRPNTSTPHTRESGNSSVDGATPLSANSKRKLSKKQEEKMAMRQKVKEEKERQKQEAKDQKEKERLEKKQKLDEEKAEKERQRREEKEKKEKEKQEKKEQFEKEKLEKQKQKDDEKKKKQEMLDAKAEEKRKKDEEKKLKEEQKQKEEEEKLKLDQKRKQAFTSFFLKPKTITTTKVEKAAENCLFIPFQVKKDMTLAPAKRQELTEEDKHTLDAAMLAGSSDLTYLKELKQGIRRPKPRVNRILRKKKEGEQEVELVHDSEAVKKVTHAVKFLRFHTDYRPPYYGTWRKKTALCPRNPWKKDDQAFDYEFDSDDEWEEEEPGESLSDSNGEEEDGGEEEEGDDDGWMVPHGYLSEGEGCEDDDEVTPEVLKARQRAKAQQWEAELKARKEVKPPLYFGCFWLDKPCTMETHISILQKFEMISFRGTPIETLISNPSMEIVADNGADKPVPQTPGARGSRKRALPEEAMPDLIRLVHGNTAGIKKLVREFRLYWKQKSGIINTSLDESKMDEDGDALDKSTLDTSIAETEKAPTVSESGDGKSQIALVDATVDSSGKGPDSNEENDDNVVSKRQLEIKINAIAVREKRPGSKKICWYVSDGILEKYSLAEIPVENKWVYVSGTPNLVKKTPAKSRDKKQQDTSEGGSTNDVKSESAAKSKAEADLETTPKSAKKKAPKDQLSIMAFAQKSQGKPSMKKKRKNENNTASGQKADLIEIDMDTESTPVGRPTPSQDLDPEANEEEEKGPVNFGPVPKDQPTILAFAKKAAQSNNKPLEKGQNKNSTGVKNGIVQLKETSKTNEDCIILD